MGEEEARPIGDSLGPRGRGGPWDREVGLGRRSPESECLEALQLDSFVFVAVLIVSDLQDPPGGKTTRPSISRRPLFGDPPTRLFLLFFPPKVFFPPPLFFDRAGATWAPPHEPPKMHLP